MYILFNNSLTNSNHKNILLTMTQILKGKITMAIKNRNHKIITLKSICIF